MDNHQALSSMDLPFVGRGRALGQVSDVDLRLLRVFMAVVNSGGFSAAEPVLGVGRSSISTYMADLETRLGLRLCHRGRAGFQMTSEGEQVFEAATRLFRAVDGFLDDIDSVHQTPRGSLALGLADALVSLPEMSITHALARFSADFPAVHVHLHMLTPEQVEQGVLDGQLQVGVVPARHRLEGLIYQSLYEETSALYVTPDHPLAIMPQAGLEEALPDCEAVSPEYALPPAGHALQRQLRSTATASNREGMAFLILTGRYVGFLPVHMATPWVAQGRLVSVALPTWQFSTAMLAIYRREQRPHRLREGFMATLAQVMSNDSA
ncbi:LysR family transcriptional regulator [Larsenimonas rhizosphaerae]|uniref:LysR family transcriptional regulator n=1 Tax=Larsenimonas rhizosphaerae TaxID=2944682 RepID=A0AA42CU02_9GAMM|nr:LysR family transcriptional regulator [Larsenimonas rhizosphaerae]MCX2523819.1 LysR family transcriptional regulator [Larsenimonas rhizosphaerae]